jgi:ubiquitin thioesterase protein OTUB1
LGAESGSPSAAAAALKGKGVLAPSPLPSPTRSEETNSLVSSDIVSDEEAEELRSANTLADGDRRFGVSWKSPLVEAMMEVPKVTRHIDSKTAFDNLSMEQQWALAEEIEMQQRQQVRFLGSLERIREAKLLSCDLAAGILSFLRVLGTI